ncbi:urease accessory protein UreF [bacterium BMS3Bbin06]|nr:urease accessory protein UreF [bacterium BMS3Bbin06]
MDRAGSLLGLFQLTDSFFPSGAFAYSWGLETYVTEGVVTDLEGFNEFLRAYLAGMIARCDALAVKLAFDAAEREDIKAVLRLDRLIHSMKLSKELREGSVQTGRQLLKVMGQLHKSAMSGLFAEGIERGETKGHHAVVFGLVCNTIGTGRDDAVPAYLYSVVSGIVSAGVRLIPLGHTDGQRVIERIKPLLIKVAGEITQLDEEDISAFAPGIEIRAMRHEHLYTRLFKS